MKERIDHSNYEAWLLDRLEGNLSPQEERALDAFLAANPGSDPGMESLPTLDTFGATLPASAKNELKRSLPPSGDPTTDRLDDHLIARLEGDLSPAQLEALRLFLDEHPEHQRTERLYGLTKLVPEAMAFAARHDLERSLPPQGLPDRFILDDFLVARLEGDLTPEQEQALSIYLAAHAEARVAAELMGHARISVPTVRYPDHAGLKKGGRVVPFMPVWTVRFAAAASVAALFGLGIWFLSRPDVPQGPQVAERTLEPARISDDAMSKESTDTVISPTVEGASTGTRPQHGSSRQGALQEPGPAIQVERSVPLPAPQEQPAPLVAQELPPVAVPKVAPEQRSVPELPVLPATAEELATAAVPATRPVSESTTLGGLMARTLREQVLDQDVPDSRPLDGDDALAAVDRGLRTVGGERAGIEVARRDDGALRSFKLRLGSNLSISASR